MPYIIGIVGSLNGVKKRESLVSGLAVIFIRRQRNDYTDNRRAG
jgi:hypothetical protein